MRSVQADRHDPVARDQVVDPVADVEHDASALVAHDVRNTGHVAAQPAEGVATLDAYGFNPDEHLPRSAGRIGNVLVAEDIRPACLVVRRCLHDSPSVVDWPTLDSPPTPGSDAWTVAP